MKRLRKILSLYMISIMSTSIMGCNNKEIVNFDEKNFTEISVEYCEQMAKGDFKTITTKFSPKIKKQLSSDKLKTTWEQVTKDIGAYQCINDTSFAIKDNTALIDVLLKYELNGLKVSFSFDKNNEISGLWLNYSPIKDATTSNDIFKEKEIVIGEGENKLQGVLTLPKNIEKPTVVIMVHGSGQSDMDETIGKGANKPFKDIAHGLAEKGIASIRYNKRYFQYANLIPKDLTIEDEVLNDVYSAIEFADKNENLNNKKIYILGHSQGGMLSPKIAKENNNVAGIISLAGSPRKLEDIILDQNKTAIEKITDKTDEEKNLMIKQIESQIHKIKNLKSNDKSTDILGINSDYWLSLNNINTAEIVKILNIPMLFIQGEEDFQVSTDVDFKAWKDLLEENKNATFKLYPNLNHLFMQSNGKDDITEYDVKGTVDNDVILDIANWIN